MQLLRAEGPRLARARRQSCQSLTWLLGALCAEVLLTRDQVDVRRPTDSLRRGCSTPIVSQLAASFSCSLFYIDNFTACYVATAECGKGPLRILAPKLPKLRLLVQTPTCWNCEPA
jgi:hypothetical protein